MIIEKIIKKLKGNSEYTLDKSYSSYDLLIVVTERAIQVIRGIWVRMFLKKADGLIFIGKAVKIQHCNKIQVGKSFIVSDYCLINALSVNGIEIGNNVSIGRNSTLLCTGVIANVGKGIKIGNGTGINSNAFLGGQGGIEIGDNVIIGPGVKIFSENHIFSNNLVNIKDQEVSRKGVKIEDNCWIGANVTVLDGVTVGNGCVIAAGAVVTKSMPSMSIIGGVPAKIIKSRT